MRGNAKFLIKTASEVFELHEPIYEIGSLQVAGQEGYADLRPFFHGKKYVGCDMRKGLGVDSIENVENLSMDDGSVGTVLMVDTLNHVQDCFKTMDEIYRALKAGGAAIVVTVMHHSICRCPDDYWRFTPSGLNYLLKKFPIRIIGAHGASEFPHTVFGIGFKSGSAERITRDFKEFYSRLSKEFCLTKEPLKGRVFRNIAVRLGLDKRYPALRRVLFMNELKMDLYQT